jgi:Fe2+ transport system protein FeoA
MIATYVDCPICGHSFDARTQAACRSCPLHNGCRLICCPACGHTTVDPTQSRLAQWLSTLMNRPRTQQPLVADDTQLQEQLILAHAPLERRLRIVGFEELSATFAEQLQSYGLTPGQHLRIMQHRPVTIVQVDRIELALESDIAHGVRVALAE